MSAATLTAPRLLDLFACEGGASAGYARAGWHVTAVDLDAAALRRNPADVRVQGDALAFLAAHGHLFDAVHASPPCQRWTRGNAARDTSAYPALIAPVRALLVDLGLPYVIENVPDARAELVDPVVLCGTMFGLRTLDDDGTALHLRRHRLFESSVPLTPPGPCEHRRGVQWAGVYGGARPDKVEARTVRRGGYVPPSAEVQSRLLGGVEWMTGKGRRECIPPAYAEHLGAQLLAAVRVAA